VAEYVGGADIQREILGAPLPHELRRIFEALKPKRIVPIYTRRPIFMEALV